MALAPQPPQNERARRYELGQRMAKMRSILRDHGYDVDRIGPDTKRLNSAWGHYQQQVRVGGKISAKGWNLTNQRGKGLSASDIAGTRAEIKAHGGAGAAVSHGGHGGLDPTASHVAKVVAKVGQTSKAQTKAAVHSKALSGGSGPAIKAGGSDVPGVKVGNPNVNKLIPAAMADKIAGLTFDPQIRQNLLDQAVGKANAKQAQADIGNWFGQAESSQATASQRDVAAADSARGSVSNEIQGILQSLGGSRGAGVAGATGVAALAALAGQGQAQEQYNADLAPIIKGQEAGQHAREQATSSQAALQLASQLTGLRGARGSAQAAALQDILSRNNAARQANFGNRESIASQALAAKSLGFDQALKLQSSIDSTRRTNAYVKATSARTASGRPSWAALSGKGRQDAINTALAPYFDPTTGGLRAGEDPNDVMNKARASLRGYGYTSARRLSFRGPGVNRASQASILGLLNSTVKGMQNVATHPATPAA